ncbi:hypothetical protein ABMA27_013486 [Loxostege sticticalis]|uniref:Major facilitator superfamily (MFS) profile domain-containing protein n=1 Tax=Loxostege sticticalis TaxID=481309 RepID=A0ABR3IFH6_LOXSC
MFLKLNKFVVNDKPEKRGHTYVQWSITVLGASVLVTIGFLIGWVSPMKKILQSDASPTGSPLSDTEVSAIASTLILTGIIGVVFCSYIAEVYGRKTAMLLIIALQMLCWIIKLVATHVAVIIVARVSAGIGYGGSYVVIPVYIREISQDSNRGLLVTLIMSTQHIGVLAIYAMGSYLNYHTTLWIALSFTTATFLLMLFVPESPAFLVKTGKLKEAAKNLATLRGFPVDDDIVQNEMNCLKDEDARFKSVESISIMAIIKNKAWFRGLLITQLIVCCVALNGTFGIVTYAWSIMKDAGVAVSPELQSFIVPILLMFGTIVPLSFVQKANRKTLLAGTFLTSGLAMGCMASALLAQRFGFAVPGWVLVLSIAVAVASYSAGIISVPTVVIIEMFRFQVRTKIMSPICMLTFGLVSIYLATFDPISNAFGLYTMFFISAGFNLLGAVIVLVWLPETKGRTVDQIEAMLLGNKVEHAPVDSGGLDNPSYS